MGIQFLALFTRISALCQQTIVHSLCPQITVITGCGGQDSTHLQTSPELFASNCADSALLRSRIAVRTLLQVRNAVCHPDQPPKFLVELPAIVKEKPRVAAEIQSHWHCAKLHLKWKDRAAQLLSSASIRLARRDRVLQRDRRLLQSEPPPGT